MTPVNHRAILLDTIEGFFAPLVGALRGAVNASRMARGYSGRKNVFGPKDQEVFFIDGPAERSYSDTLKSYLVQKMDVNYPVQVVVSGEFKSNKPPEKPDNAE